jgi:hypothetical protein
MNSLLYLTKTYSNFSINIHSSCPLKAPVGPIPISPKPPRSDQKKMCPLRLPPGGCPACSSSPHASDLAGVRGAPARRGGGSRPSTRVGKVDKPGRPIAVLCCMSGSGESPGKSMETTKRIIMQSAVDVVLAFAALGW